MVDSEAVGQVEAAVPYIVNLTECADLLGVSENTLRKVITRNRNPDDGEPFPILKGGAHGVPYELDARQVAAWWQANAARRAAEADARGEAIDQMRLELFGANVADQTPKGLTPLQIKQELENRLLANKLGRENGDLVRAADVEASALAAFTSLRQRLQQLVGEIAKDHNLDRPGRAQIQERIDDTLTSAARELSNESLYDDAIANAA